MNAPNDRNPTWEEILLRFFFWLRQAAGAYVEVYDEIPKEVEGDDGTGEEMKPERIQLWRLILKVVLAVLDGAAEETRKSGETRSGAPDPKEVE